MVGVQVGSQGAAGDGDKQILIAGKSTKEAVKTIAQGRPDCLR
jgi:hypothetical protein